MRLQGTLNRIFTLAALAAIFAGASLAAAQEATATESAAAPQFQGVSTLMLLLGLAAVATVGLVWTLRERSLPPSSDETP